jgi:hypothetical protein
LEVCGISVNEAEARRGYVIYTARGLSLAIVFGILNSLAATRRFSGSNYIRYLHGSWGERSLTEVDKTTNQTRRYPEQRGKIDVTISEVQRGPRERRSSMDDDELSD